MQYETIGDSSALWYFYDADGNPSGIRYKDHNGTVNDYYFVCNWRGDVIQIYNASGTLVGSYTYDAWGKVTENATSADTQNITETNPIRYRGYYYDTETRLYYLKSRYYDPATRRFLNEDSQLNFCNVNGCNMFTYCNNNPVLFSDPTGHIPFLLVTGLAGAAIGAVVGGVKAKKTGGSVWKGALKGAAIGGLVGAGVGAIGGAALAGSAVASTAAVISGAGTFAMTVGAGGLGAGASLVADNLSRLAKGTSTVLYSGGERARQAAINFSDNVGGITIDYTAIGKFADMASKNPGADFTSIWSQASATFCHQASGVVNAFVANSAYRGVDSIFWNTEMRILVNNPRVTEIIIHIFE